MPVTILGDPVSEAAFWYIGFLIVLGYAASDNKQRAFLGNISRFSGLTIVGAALIAASGYYFAFAVVAPAPGIDLIVRKIAETLFMFGFAPLILGYFKDEV